MVTILVAVPGLLLLSAMAAAPLFQLWDDRASERAASGTVVAIPAPRVGHEPLRVASTTRA